MLEGRYMKKVRFNTAAAVFTSALLSSQVFAITDDPVDPVDPVDPPSSGTVRGPDPTLSALESTRSGPYSVRTENVSNLSASGFGGGTIHYPTNAGENMGAIAVIPGYVSYESSIEWWGPRLASWGFVVITIDTNTIYDQPDSRADQLSAALDHLIDESGSSSSPISGLVDASRLGVIGWSMGGGGTLKLATERNLKAIIPQAPWYSGFNSFDRITTPTMIIACESDAIAPVGQHASPFYNDIPNSTAKAFLEINGGSHYCANSGYSDEDILGKYGISWMKRFMDNDTRYSQFLCGPNHESDRSISEYRDTCNY
ncbi:alpha/beta hydrolase [Ketobacter sp. MCCC 1A13808]|nr:alpha/beta hydrolase [Ketobacter sp. MCCC 1A13808]